MFQLSIILFIAMFCGNSVLASPDTELLDAAKKGDLESIKISFQKNNNIHFKDELGKNALMYAAESGDSKSVDYLLENGADVLAKDKNGKTASNFAKEKGKFGIQKNLEKLENEFLNSKATGIVTFVSGLVYEGKRRLKTGDYVLENKTIYVGKKSLCDLQVKQSGSDLTIRVKENSVFTLKYSKDENDNVFSAVVKYGGALFNVGKVKNGEKIQTQTPTIVAAVRGTIYEVTMDDFYNTKVSTYEGAVRTRIRAGEIEDDESVSNDPNIKKLIEKLEANSSLVEAGKSLELPKKDQEEIVIKVDGPQSYLRAIKKEPVLNENIPKLEESKKLKITTIKDSDIKLKQQEASDIFLLDTKKLEGTTEKSEVVSHIEKRKDEKMAETFQPETLKNPETIKLKNGQMVNGSVYQIGSKYVIFSTDKKKTIYDQSEVQEFVFE